MNTLHFFCCLLVVSIISVALSKETLEKKFNKDIDEILNSKHISTGTPPTQNPYIKSCVGNTIKIVYEAAFASGLSLSILLLIIYGICIKINCSKGWFLFWVIFIGVLCGGLSGIYFLLTLREVDKTFDELEVVLTKGGTILDCDEVGAVLPGNLDVSQIDNIKKNLKKIKNLYIGISIHNIIIGIMSLACLLIHTNKSNLKSI
jgi:hypothetical protein